MSKHKQLSGAIETTKYEEGYVIVFSGARSVTGGVLPYGKETFFIKALMKLLTDLQSKLKEGEQPEGIESNQLLNDKIDSTRGSIDRLFLRSEVVNCLYNKSMDAIIQKELDDEDDEDDEDD